MAKRTDEGAKGSVPAFLGLIMVKGVGPFCICLTVYEWLRVPRSGCFRAEAETGAANDERERERQGMKEITRKQFMGGMAATVALGWRGKSAAINSERIT